MRAAELVRTFAVESQLVVDCGNVVMPEDDFANLANLSLSNRCRTDGARARVCRFLQDFMGCALYPPQPLPFYGSAAAPAVAQWLDQVRLRGSTVPHLARYCLMAFGDAMGVKFPVDHPAAMAAAAEKRNISAKTASEMPLTLIEKLEATACDNAAPQGLQLAASIFCLMVFDSLRFADIRDAAELWTTTTAISGMSLNHKDNGWAIMAWAAPKAGLKSNAKWRLPVLSLRGTVRPPTDANATSEPLFHFPPTYISKDREVNSDSVQIGRR